MAQSARSVSTATFSGRPTQVGVCVTVWFRFEWEGGGVGGWVAADPISIRAALVDLSAF
jgi:hypothetical protein